MRRLILKISMTLDGFVCGPNGEMDWQIRSRDEGGKAWVADTLWQAGLHAFGSRTYNAIAGYWPASTDLLAAPMNAIPKAVFTHQAAFEPAPGWGPTEVVSGDLATGMARLKQQPGKDIIASGGAGFAQSLVRLGLIDEYRLVVHPVAIGAGRALFGELPRPLDLKLVSTTLFASGTQAHIYRPA